MITENKVIENSVLWMSFAGILHPSVRKTSFWRTKSTVTATARES